MPDLKKVSFPSALRSKWLTPLRRESLVRIRNNAKNLQVVGENPLALNSKKRRV